MNFIDYRMNELSEILHQEIFPLINKPGRYTGNEINVIKKDWSKDLLKFALIFPDLYEIGMSHIGFEILYHILNRQTFIAAERVYAPAADLEARLREKELPLFSLESHQPLARFDILGFTLQYELHYTNVLTILDLARVPILAKERGDSDPLVIAGGPCAFNPEPLADFIDAFVIGDGEEVTIELAQIVHQLLEEGGSRNDILTQIARIQGIYVPDLYELRFDEPTGQQILKPKKEGVPEKIVARTVEQLKSEYYPEKPLVPLMETTHDRYSLEIMRGCTQGCRFCNAGIIYRPVRERSVDDLVQQASAVISNTGYREISLASLSTSDYSALTLLLSRLNRILEPQMVNVSFPSLRTETFTAEIARYAGKVKKSGLTLAPEAGTERLRNVINKTNSNEDLLRAMAIAFNEGWDRVKLYFMIGQPSETREDLDGIIDLIKQAFRLARGYQGKSIHISVSPFCPKPHTPFQWAQQDSIQAMSEKIFYIKDRLPGNRIKFNWREPEVAFLEGVIARGDRKMGPVIYHAWKSGARFDAWSDQFRFEFWKDAFEHHGIDPEHYTRKRELDDPLPWDHISKGVTKKFLKKEFQWSLEASTTPDCRQATCNVCGMMSHPVCQDILYQQKKTSPIADVKVSDDQRTEAHYGRSRKRLQPVGEPSVRAIRLKYEKREPIRFTSHLDLVRIFERAFRRAGIKLVYSRGFHPHPRIAFSPPLAMGFTSHAEYMDVQYYRDRDRDIKSLLNRKLPEGLRILETRNLYGKHQSLASIINRAEYDVTLYRTFDQSYLNQLILDFLARDTVVIKRTRGDQQQELDIRPFVESVQLVRPANSLHISVHFINGRTARVQEILSEMLSLNDEEVALSRVNRSDLFIQYGQIKATPLDV